MSDVLPVDEVVATMRTDGPLIIALDGSAHSDQTLAWGLTEARLRGADVVLARAWHEPREYTQWTWYPILDDLRFDAEAERYLAEVHRRVTATHPDLRVTTRLLHGPEVATLLALTDDAQLLVVGAAGHRPRGHVGRVAAHLAAHARCPVALVRGSGTGPADAAAPADTRGPTADHGAEGAPVVVGVDGSDQSLAAAHEAAREAALRGRPLVLLHARPTVVGQYGRGTVLLPTPTRLDDDPAHRAADTLRDALRAAHPDVDVQLRLVEDDPVQALLAAAREACVLVLGSRGLGAFRGMLLGSVSTDVVRAAQGTVLVVHAG